MSSKYGKMFHTTVINNSMPIHTSRYIAHAGRILFPTGQVTKQIAAAVNSDEVRISLMPVRI
jgi:hypothetical protein